jgi:hypothetical protein
MPLNKKIAELPPAVVSSARSRTEGEDVKPNSPKNTSELEIRKASADRYFAEDLEGQQHWYDSRARSYKVRSELLAFAVISLVRASHLFRSLEPLNGSPQYQARLALLSLFWRAGSELPGMEKHGLHTEPHRRK